MRLDSTEIEAIKDSINQFISPLFYTLYLFGSRLDTNKKGGDIDLLLVLSDGAPSKSQIMANKHKILAEIKSAIGDQKIDLLVAVGQELLSDAFVREIFKTAVKL